MALGSVNVPGALGRELKEADRALEARIASAEKTLSGMEKIPGSVPPTSQVTAQVGQIYINTATGEEWVCIKADADGTEWEKRETQKLQVGVFSAGTAPPEDKHLLWIDTTANTGGLKYWNGSAWTTVPVGYV